MRRLPQKFMVLLLLVFCLCGMPSFALSASVTYQRTLEQYQLPDVTLINQNGKRARLKNIIESDGKPVIVDFIFGTCTTICPVLSVGFANLQQKLGDTSHKVHLVSITIDPEHDSPKVMQEYLKRYRSKPGWDFYTGSRKDIDLVMRAFNAYIPNKMSHYPLTLIWSQQDKKWIRIFGLLSSSEFMDEVKKVGIK